LRLTYRLRTTKSMAERYGSALRRIGPFRRVNTEQAWHHEDMAAAGTSGPVNYEDALAALEAAYGAVDELAGRLSPIDLLAFSRCRGWVVADVLFHVLCDAQRALVALASPDTGPPDRDFVSYWAGFAAQSGGDSVAGVWSVRRSAAAYRDGAGAVALWRETAPAVVRAAGRADPLGCVTTQGHVLAVPDLLATLATEAVVHHLDMTVNLDTAPGPDHLPVALAARTLDGLLDSGEPRGAGYPAGWTAEEYLLKGTGRLPLTRADRSALGVLAARFPLIA
jgi:hypothetical protein